MTCLRGFIVRITLLKMGNTENYIICIPFEMISFSLKIDMINIRCWAKANIIVHLHFHCIISGCSLPTKLTLSSI